MSKRDDNPINDTNRFDDEIFISLFRKSAHEYLENDLLCDLLDKNDDDQCELSEVCDKKIKKMINKEIRKEKNKRISKRLPKIATVALSILVVCFITIISVDALRVDFLNLFINTEENITKINFDENNPNDNKLRLEDMIKYIPNGFELTTEDLQGNKETLIYTNDSGGSIIMHRFLLDSSTFSVDTEDANYKRILINENQGFYSMKNDLTTLLFTTESYVYSITSNIELEEIQKIAENIK